MTHVCRGQERVRLLLLKMERARVTVKDNPILGSLRFQLGWRLRLRGRPVLTSFPTVKVTGRGGQVVMLCCRAV